jgi:hypothetical protein
MPADNRGPWADLRAIAPGFKGNLHDQAWDVADKLVKGMRGGGGPAPQ